MWECRSSELVINADKTADTLRWGGRWGEGFEGAGVGGGGSHHYGAPYSLMYPRRRINKYTKYVQNICSLQCFCLIQENFRHRVIEVRLRGWGE